MGFNTSRPQKYRITAPPCHSSFEDIGWVLSFSAVCHLICSGNGSFKKMKTSTMIYPSRSSMLNIQTVCILRNYHLNSARSVSQCHLGGDIEIKISTSLHKRQNRGRHREMRPYIHFLRLPQKCCLCGRPGFQPPCRCRLSWASTWLFSSSRCLWTATARRPAWARGSADLLYNM